MDKNQTSQMDETTSVSRKREITATVTATAVTVVLGVAANVLVSKLSKRVHDQIAPPTETE